MSSNNRSVAIGPLPGHRSIWGQFTLAGVLAWALAAGAVHADGDKRSTSSGSKAKPWFGVALPPAVDQGPGAVDKAYAEPELKPLSLRLSPADDPFVSIEGADLMRRVRDVVAFAEQSRADGELYWGRIGGSQGERAAAEYAAATLSGFGIEDVRTVTVPGREQWRPTGWNLTLIGDPGFGAGTIDITLESAFPAQFSAATSADGLEAELVYVGLGRPADLSGRDLHGKVAVLHGMMQPNTFFHSARGVAEDLAEAGASGVIVTMEASGNHQYALEDTGSHRIPSFIVGGADGAFLRAVLGKDQPVSVRMQLATETTDDWTTQNVIAHIPGTGDGVVIVIAHLDSYFYGANDNATGVATLLSLAEFFSSRATPRLDSTLVLVATGAHHDESIGVEHFIDNNADTLARSTLVLNIEHTASIMSTYRGPLKIGRFTVPAQVTTANTDGVRDLMMSRKDPVLVALFAEAIDRYGLVVSPDISRRPTGDAFHFVAAGQTVVQLIESNIWFHSTGDTPDSIMPQGLERTARAYAWFLSRVATN